MIEYDNEGNKLTPEQSIFFKDSKIRDHKGRLIVCYHGSSSSDHFSIFDINKANPKLNIIGFYFCTKERKSILADAYCAKTDNLYRCYLNIINPLDTYCKHRWLIGAHDGVISRFSASDAQYWKEHRYQEQIYAEQIVELIAFNSSQIKAITNQKPTLSINIYE